MEQTTLLLIVLTNIFLVVILGLLAFLVFKLFQQRMSSREETDKLDSSRFHPNAIERLKGYQKITTKKAHLFCPNHTEEPGETPCGICDKLFCKACIRPYKNMHFCKEHMPLIMRFEWDEVLTIKTSSTDPEEGVRLYEVKKDLFESAELATYVETHYKINVDQDYIETYLVLFGQREQIPSLRDKFKAFLGQNASQEKD